MSDQQQPRTPAVREPPRRIQRQRTKGWKMPPNTVYVGRPTRFGNPFVPFPKEERTLVLEQYRMWLTTHRGLFLTRVPPTKAEIEALRGKNLACFCRLDQPCHADVLLELANAD